MTADIMAKLACVSEKNSSSREVTGSLCQTNKNQRNVSFFSVILTILSFTSFLTADPFVSLIVTDITKVTWIPSGLIR